MSTSHDTPPGAKLANHGKWTVTLGGTTSQHFPSRQILDSILDPDTLSPAQTYSRGGP